jgi:hypothetical protein
MTTNNFDPLKANPFFDAARAMASFYGTGETFWAGMTRYAGDFLIPFLVAAVYFQRVEAAKIADAAPAETSVSYADLLEFNGDLFSRSAAGALASVNAFAAHEIAAFAAALHREVFRQDGEKLFEYAARQKRLMELVVYRYPKAIQAVEPEYGFHFERKTHELVAETDRFYLYRIAPSDSTATIRTDGKPILILPPYVLGANILGFLPGENKSYAHAYANFGVPTYIRILKDISTTEALQNMTGEDDARDTRTFCEAVVRRHGRPVTLNGYCQGGFAALCNLLSGELDGLVDAFITCVAPMDGTRSRGLSAFLEKLPPRFNDLAYGTKTLPNGNTVADGKLMGWVYKLRSIENESPLTVFFRDLAMFARNGGESPAISKTAAALNYWLTYERKDLPMEITRMSFASYNSPITRKGVLPVKLFGRKLELSRLKEMGIPWLICYGESDDLVEKEAALAPRDYIDVEVSPFPKGHVAIATSWSNPSSACALHTRFGEGKWRGPVRFHLDLQEKLDRPSPKKQRSKRR